MTYFFDLFLFLCTKRVSVFGLGGGPEVDADRFQLRRQRLRRLRQPRGLGRRRHLAAGRGLEAAGLVQDRFEAFSWRFRWFSRNFVERSEVLQGLLRVHQHPAMADRMQKLHSGHQDLHPYDIHLFWGDVRERVRQQVEAYLARP